MSPADDGIAGAQTPAHDPRNADVLVSLNGALVPKGEAKVSIFDAGFVLGDGVWEGIRLVEGRLVFLEEHLDRLYAGARTIRMDLGLDQAAMQARIEAVLDANGMEDGVHIRLMATRGVKAQVNQDPRNALGAATIAIVAEWKRPSAAVRETGLTLFTSAIRTSAPDVFDMRLNSHSRLNYIIALTQAIEAGADEAVMLDPHGFVASCNSTNLFYVRGGALLTSTGRYCFNGITRGKVLLLAERLGLAVRETDFTLAEAYEAEEAFVTGTFGGLTPVRALDGRTYGVDGPVARRLREAYEALVREAV